ncbi:MAG: DNA repair protein RecO, partial [Gemmatimonadetes bacterium]|nr:DNA repair protein RecO [Gemmatimonadota bacterium]
MSLVTTRAILFRAHAYSETSQVLRFYTEDLGLVGVMARGSRRQASKGRGAVDTFGEGVAVLSYRPTRELQSLREFSPTVSRLGLGGSLARLSAASVLAEVVLKHAGQERHPELFARLSEALDDIASEADATLLSVFLARTWQVVGLLGFSPELTHCTTCGRTLGSEEMGTFDLVAGGVRCGSCGRAPEGRRLGPVARGHLSMLVDGQVAPGLRKPEAHVALLDDFVTVHMLGGRRLQSFQFLRSAGP